MEVFYPDAKYYKWIENKIFDDRAFVAVVASFPEIKGWIDTDQGNNGSPPSYSVEALNTVAFVIAQKLEAAELHGMVYGRQLWGEVASVFPNPNSIVVSVVDPFSSFRNSSEGGTVFGDTQEERITEIQAIMDQLIDAGGDWFESVSYCFHDRIIRFVQESFEVSFQQTEGGPILPEISLFPDWGAFKVNILEAVTCHNMDLFTTGLIKEIYHEYIRHIYKSGVDEIYHSNNLPKFSYDTLNKFLPIWEILRGLSLSEDDGV